MSSFSNWWHRNFSPAVPTTRAVAWSVDILTSISRGTVGVKLTERGAKAPVVVSFEMTPEEARKLGRELASAIAATGSP